MTAWTRQKPTTPGWYWWRDANIPFFSHHRLVKVFKGKNCLFVRLIEEGKEYKLGRIGGEFQGPIEPEA